MSPPELVTINLYKQYTGSCHAYGWQKGKMTGWGQQICFIIQSKQASTRRSQGLEEKQGLKT